MKKFSKLLALLLAACLIFAMAACGSSSSSDTEDTSADASADTDTAEEDTSAAGTVSDESITIALDSEPSGLYAQYSYDSASGTICNFLYDTLVEWDDEQDCAVAGLATDWEWVDDTHLRMYLRDDVYFADGTNFTAADVIYTFQVGGEYQASSYSRIFDADSFVAEDDYTVVLALNSAYPIVVDILAADVYGIICEASVEAVGGVDEAARNPLIGSGKYIFSDWTDGQSITLVRNDDYWDQDNLPYYAEVTFTFISDSTSRAMAVQSGDADVAIGLGTTQVEGLESDSNVTVSVINTSTNRTLYMNCSDEALSSEEVRTALWYLIDAEAIREIANSGYGELSETNFSQFCAVYASPGDDFTREVDVDYAIELLAEAGYDDSNPLTLELMMPSEGDNETMAQLVQAQLAEAGITVEIEMLEIGAYLEDLWSGDYQLTITSGDQYDYEKLLYMVDGRIDPATASGGAQYSDDTLQAMLDECYAETDDDARNELYAEIQAYLLEHHIVIGICNQVNVIATSSSITGATMNISGVMDLTTCYTVE